MRTDYGGEDYAGCADADGDGEEGDDCESGRAGKTAERVHLRVGREWVWEGYLESGDGPVPTS